MPPSHHQVLDRLVALRGAGVAGRVPAGTVGVEADVDELSGDVVGPLRMHRHRGVGDPGDRPVPEPPRRSVVGHDPITNSTATRAEHMRPYAVAAWRCSRHTVVSGAFQPPRWSSISTALTIRTWSWGQGSPAREVAWRVWA